MQTVSLESYSRRHAAPAGSSLVKDIAYFARVSNPTSQISALNDEGLINYLIRHKHWSPFEMATSRSRWTRREMWPAKCCDIGLCLSGIFPALFGHRNQR